MTVILALLDYYYYAYILSTSTMLALSYDTGLTLYKLVLYSTAMNNHCRFDKIASQLLRSSFNIMCAFIGTN